MFRGELTLGLLSGFAIVYLLRSDPAVGLYQQLAWLILIGTGAISAISQAAAVRRLGERVKELETHQR